MTFLRYAAALCAVSVVAPPLAARADVVVNGNFEDPSRAGVNSDYRHTPGGNSDEGTWWIHPWDPGSPWHSVQHTPGGQAAMSVNGDDSNSAGQLRVWFQTVPVQPGRTYEFSTWALATAPGFAGYSLRFAFDGVQAGPVVSPSAPFTWEEFSITVTPTNPTMEISIVNVSGITFPNDFMLDDISLSRVCACDFNGDDVLNSQDFFDFLTAFFQNSADFNGDGVTNSQDFFDFLTCFFAGC